MIFSICKTLVSGTCGTKSRTLTMSRVLRGLLTKYSSQPLVIRYTGNIARMPTVTIDKRAKEAVIDIHGYGYADIDRVGNIMPWRIARLSEAARVTMAHPQYDPTPPALTNFFEERFPGLGIFLGAARYEITPEFYKREHYYNPITFNYTINNVGRSSYSQSLRAFSKVTGKLLHTDHIFNVCVDLNTKRPAQVPDVFIKYFEDIVAATSEIIPPVQPCIKPNDCSYCDVHVDTSLLDYYYHTNQSYYIKFAHDAISQLVFAKQIDVKAKDFALMHIKQLEIIYKGETTPGDCVQAYVWLNGDSEVCVQLEKKGIIVAQCKFQLY